MVIVTLADLNARSQETSSTPPQNYAAQNTKQSRNRQVGKDEQPHVCATAELRCQLQALDKALSDIQPGHCNQSDIANITDAFCNEVDNASVPEVCTSYVNGRMYVNGSEELYLALKGLRVPHLIPNLYTEAFKTVLAGRYHVNNDVYLDTFSTMRNYLRELDRLCETDLEGKFARLEDQGTFL